MVKSEFKMGSMDKMMELSEAFGKIEKSLEDSCIRHEKQFFETQEKVKDADKHELEAEIPVRPKGQFAYQSYVKNKGGLEGQ